MKKLIVSLCLTFVCIVPQVEADYNIPYENILASLDETEKSTIKATVSACADLMSFDINNYDYDTVFKYLLFSHQNFKLLTDIDPTSSHSSSLGGGNVSLVSGDFIDYIMENVLCIPPEKPPVNNLLTRGFCYTGGYYYYNVGFDVSFSTAIGELKGVYDLGDSKIYVVFSDTYTEGDTKSNEESFAVLKNNGGYYSLLRLGMGETLLSGSELGKYVRSEEDTDTNSLGDTKLPLTKNTVLLIVMVVIFLIGAVGLSCALIALTRTKRR